MHFTDGQITYAEAPLTQAELELFFRQDSALLNRFHVEAPASSYVCARRTFLDLKRAPGLTFYLLYQGAEKIGYFGLQRVDSETRALTGFFLTPSARCRKVAQAFWDIITNEFDGLPFLCGVYAKNEAAVKFLRRKSTAFTTAETEDKSMAVIFTINGESN